MKATGIVRKVDDLGRVVIPKELRKTLGIKEFDPLEIFTEGDTIILRKHKVGCVECSSLDDLTQIGSEHICKGCLTKKYMEVK